jgi:hypothetical protein
MSIAREPRPTIDDSLRLKERADRESMVAPWVSNGPHLVGFKLKLHRGSCVRACFFALLGVREVGLEFLVFFMIEEGKRKDVE